MASEKHRQAFIKLRLKSAQNLLNKAQNELTQLEIVLYGKPKPIKRVRSSSTGQFVKKSKAKSDPRGTVTETIKRKMPFNKFVKGDFKIMP